MPNAQTPVITQDPAAGKGVQVQMPNGLNVFVTECILSEKDGAGRDKTQPWVSILTEDMPEWGYDGNPEIQVTLNDATLYDREPDKEQAYNEVYVVAAELSDPPAVFASRAKAEEFAETYDPPRRVDALLVCEAELADKMIAERKDDEDEDFEGRPDVR
jgi:hypothetical protein